MIELAKSALADGDCTLAVANHGTVRKYHRRGVADLLTLLSDEPEYLKGACVADKIIGKAAASLMITGGASSIYSRVITRDAIQMLEGAGIPTAYGSLTDIVTNRTHTGRCPLDTLCAPLDDPADMVSAIRSFLDKQAKSPL